LSAYLAALAVPWPPSEPVPRYGTRVRLWFSDVRHEDEDMYRFMQDTAKRWWQHYGVRLYVHRNERTPLMVAEQKVIIPNERRAPAAMN
jgi:hypothetical protein